MITHLNLPYNQSSPSSSNPPHPRHIVDVYLPDDHDVKPPQGLIVFIHGGAWRTSSSQDPTLDDLPRGILPQQFALALPNYRLSDQPEDKIEGKRKVLHPDHVLDCRMAVEWLVRTGAGGLINEKTKENVWLMGHSAGAHIIAHFLLETPSIAPIPADIRSTIKGFFFSETITDIDALVEEYPDYQEWFITSAFGPPPYLTSSPSHPSSPYALPPSSSLQEYRIMISHSKADTLVSTSQPIALASRLAALGLKVEVFTDEDIGEHDEVLKDARFGQRVRQWVGVDV
ncbi:BNA7 [Phaffia rhodozyma]|uniref:BNA7 n=1 Tax=Phaffia rhodozyma TaxID=264483 RepID=A0A0F7SPG1_PHARH|nr:BNA7 [Phaffia rhodozyma]